MPEPLEKPVSTGIAGLDIVLRGGIPRDTLLLLEGSPGSGKTTIALQILQQGIRTGETCLLVSNAETPEQLQTIASAHGWDLDGIHLSEWRERPGADGLGDMEYTIFPEAEVEVGESLRYLVAEVERLKPTLLVLDSVSALRSLAPSAAFYRRQLRRIRDFLRDRSCTAIIIDDASPGEKDLRSRTLADAIIELHQVDFAFGADRRRLRVRKVRGASYVSGVHDFTLEQGGVTLFPRLIAHEHAEARNFEPAMSGMPELDALAGGGLPRGTSTLIVGPSGTGKSTFASLYACAAAERGERSSLFLFDERPETLLARSQGLGLSLGSHIEAGRISISDLDPAEMTPGQITDLVVRQVEEEDVSLVVIDTLNGYLHSAAEDPTVLLHLRELLTYLARRRVVTILIITQHGLLSSDMATPVDVSYLADNVFLLRYFEADGRVHQALSMIKKRTGPHERTIREFRLAAGGVELSPPLRHFSAVLSGAPTFHGPPKAEDDRD